LDKEVIQRIEAKSYDNLMGRLIERLGQSA